MRDEIDTALHRLGRDEVPARLTAIDSAVLARVASHRFAQPGEFAALRVAAIGGALMMGVAGGMIPAGGADAQPSLTPIAGASDLAPASLLLGK